MSPQNPPIMTKRNFGPKVVTGHNPVRGSVGQNINFVFHPNNQQTMKRQRPVTTSPGAGTFSNGNRLHPRAENDGYGEEETSGSVERKICKIRRRGGGGDDSVEIIFDASNTGKVPEKNVIGNMKFNKVF